MQYNYKKITVILICVCIASFLFLPQFSFSQTSRDEMLNIKDDIDEKEDELAEINKKIKEYENIVRQKQREKLSLENQISIVDNQMKKAALDINAAELQIGATELELEAIDKQIGEKQSRIEEQKKQLSEFVRQIQKEDQKETLEILLLYESFSEFFDHLNQLEEVNSNLTDVLISVKGLKEELEQKKKETEIKKEALVKLKDSLENKKITLVEQKVSKDWLKEQAADSESKFRELVYEMRIEQQKIDDEVRALEENLRKKLEEADNGLLSDGSELVLSWPVDPTRGITAYFHDPDYPYRYLFEHPAIDIRAYQGTPIRSPAPGYVGKIKYDGSTRYGYILLVHRDGISTLYGHVSKPVVSADTYVERGQIVGYSGGMPGTPGAGNLSSGPHLHFEVRLNSVPVNPLNYLLEY